MEPTHDEMENLFVNNTKLDKIKAHLNRFNPIKIMKMERMEIRHSAILSWLLDPTETHGLEDKFLKSFLAETLRGKSSRVEPTALGITRSEMRNVEIRREWENIDILIECPDNQWIFVIENKYNSKQHTNQLTRYKEKIKKAFPDIKAICCIFLSLRDEEPEDSDYLPIRYEVICDLLSILIQKHENQLAPEIKTFLNHYLETIEEATGMNKELSEMERLAKELYREHKKVLDFVIEHGSSSDFSIAAEMLFGENTNQFETIEIDNQSFVFSGLSNNTVSFLPEDWYKALKGATWEGCENWWAKLPLIAWLRLSTGSENGKGTIGLYAEVGPISDHAIRTKMIEAIKLEATKSSNGKIAFQKGATDEGRRYSRFFKKNSATVDDTQDTEKLAATMKKLLNDFRQEFNIVTSALYNFSSNQKNSQ